MLAASEEVFIWEDLRHSVSNLLDDVDSGRTQVGERWNDPKPVFKQLERILSEAYEQIETRLKELRPTQDDEADRAKAQCQAKKALSHGVNYHAFKGLPYDDTDSALRYLEEHGLVSMNYDATRTALSEYRKETRNEEQCVTGA